MLFNNVIILYYLRIAFCYDCTYINKSNQLEVSITKGDIPKLCTGDETSQIKSLYIEHCNVRELNIELFKNYYNLKYFICNYNSIRSLRSLTFYNIPILTISLCSCKLEVIDKFAFFNLTNLIVIQLENNLLTNIFDYSFLYLNNLNTFSAMLNNISHLKYEDCSFLRQNSIKIINFRSNRIKHIDNKTFSNMHNVIINLENNLLGDINEYVFTNSTISFLQLQFNNITDISKLLNSDVCLIHSIDIVSYNTEDYPKNTSTNFYNLGIGIFFTIVAVYFVIKLQKKNKPKI